MGEFSSHVSVDGGGGVGGGGDGGGGGGADGGEFLRRGAAWHAGTCVREGMHVAQEGKQSQAAHARVCTVFHVHVRCRARVAYTNLQHLVDAPETPPEKISKSAHSPFGSFGHAPP